MSDITKSGSGHLTEAGARRLGRPDLANAQVTWVGIDPAYHCVFSVSHEGVRLCSSLSYEGKHRGITRD